MSDKFYRALMVRAIALVVMSFLVGHHDLITRAPNGFSWARAYSSVSTTFGLVFMLLVPAGALVFVLVAIHRTVTPK